MEKNGLLEIIAVHRTGDNLDEAVKKDKDYQAALEQQKREFEAMDALGLTPEQKKAIDRLITENNHVGAVYGAVAYRCGLEDGIKLWVEVDRII